MERLFRKLSIFCFVVAAATLLVHFAGLALRLMMELRHVYAVDALLTVDELGFLKGKDKLIYFLLTNSISFGVVSMIMFVLAQLFIQLFDVIYVKKWMEVTAETQIKLLKENEKELIGLFDRIIPVIALFVFAFILLSELIKTSYFLQDAELTRRIVLLPSLTTVTVGWAATFFISLLISLIFLWYFRSRMLTIYGEVKAE